MATFGNEDTSIGNLPDEMLIAIFSYLRSLDIIRCCCVCKMWKTLLDDDSLWHALFKSSFGKRIGEGWCTQHGRDPACFHSTSERTWKQRFICYAQSSKRWTEGKFATTILRGHSRGIRTIHYDDNILVSAGEDGNWIIWDLTQRTMLVEGYEILKHQCHRGDINAAQVNSTNCKVLTCSDDTTLKIWDYQARTLDCMLNGHSRLVLCCSWGGPRDLSQIASGSGDHTVRLWDTDRGKCIRTLTGHTEWVMTLAFEASAHRVISGGGDRHILVHDLRVGGNALPVATLRQHNDRVEALKYDIHNELVFAGDVSGDVRVWDLRMMECCGVFLRTHKSTVAALWLDVDLSRLVTGSWDRDIAVWNVRSANGKQLNDDNGVGNVVLKEIGRLQTDTGGGRFLSVQFDEFKLVAGCRNQLVYILDFDGRDEMPEERIEDADVRRPHASRPRFVEQLKWHSATEPTKEGQTGK